MFPSSSMAIGKCPTLVYLQISLLCPELEKKQISISFIYMSVYVLMLYKKRPFVKNWEKPHSMGTFKAKLMFWKIETLLAFGGKKQTKDV